MKRTRSELGRVTHGLMAASFLLASWSAYGHLVLIPHQYCAEHHAVEPVDDHGDPTGGPAEGHKHCDWEFLLGLSVDLSPAPPTGAVAAPGLSIDVRPAHDPVPHDTPVTLIAPKQSPPTA